MDKLLVFYFTLLFLGKAQILLSSFPTPDMSKYSKSRLGSLDLLRPTDLGERKTLNSNPKRCCFGKSVVYYCIILWLSVLPKIVVGPS